MVFRQAPLGIPLSGIDQSCYFMLEVPPPDPNYDFITTLTASGNPRHPPGYEWCWCKWFDNGCGLVRLLRTHQHLALKEERILESKYDEMTCTIHEQSLTLIIDQSYGSQHVAMHGLWEPEYESEDDNNWIYLLYFTIALVAVTWSKFSMSPLGGRLGGLPPIAGGSHLFTQ